MAAKSYLEELQNLVHLTLAAARLCLCRIPKPLANDLFYLLGSIGERPSGADTQFAIDRICDTLNPPLPRDTTPESDTDLALLALLRALQAAHELDFLECILRSPASSTDAQRFGFSVVRSTNFIRAAAQASSSTATAALHVLTANCPRPSKLAEPILSPEKHTLTST